MERLTKQLGDGRIVATDGVAFVRNAKYGSFFEGRALEKLAAYEDAEERGMFGKWIPISERQPEDDKYIMLSFDNFTLPDIGRYEVDKDGNGAFYPGDDEKSYAEYDLFVNAWMPLPDPYRESEEEQ